MVMASMDMKSDIDELKAAFSAWIEVQKDLGEAMFSHRPIDGAQAFAEGYQHLIRLMSSASLMRLEMDDPDHPVLYHDTDDMRKLTLDNPDTIYLRCRISSKNAYRLSGRLGNGLYNSFAIETSHIGPGGHVAIEQVNLRDFCLDDEGNFEVYLGGNPREFNWLPLAERAHSFFIRQVFAGRRSRREADCQIERLGQVSYSAPTARQIAQRVQDAADFARWWAGRAYSIAQTVAKLKNAFHFDGRQGRDRGADSSTDYMLGGWELARDEALVIRIVANSPFLYWGLQLGNYWAETLDYRFSKVSINNHEAIPNADGSWTIVLAHDNPGAINWLDLSGRRQGIIALRWLDAVEEPPMPEITVVNIQELKARMGK